MPKFTSDQRVPENRLLQLLDKLLTTVAMVGGGITLSFMTLFSVFNVLIMRKAMNSPIQGAEDMLFLALVVVVAFAIPYGARTGAHIEIEILEPRMSRQFARISLIFVKIVGFILLLILSWRLYKSGTKAASFGESSPQLLISFEPFYYCLSVFMALYCLVLLFDIYQIVTKGRIAKLEISRERQ